MAPTHSKPSPNKLRTQRKLVLPPIGLERPTEKKDYAKGEFATVKLRNVPNDATSMTYDYQVPFFSTGTPEEWLKFKARFNRVITGQHMTTAAHFSRKSANCQSYNSVRIVLKCILRLLASTQNRTKNIQ